MECYPGECREYSVTPMLLSPDCPTKCCDEPELCFPCLPRCPKGVVYGCGKKTPKAPHRSPCREEECCMPQECCHHVHHRPRSPPPTRQSSSHSPHCCTTSCHPICKPVKTKYVIPCYRYEDGRINQPTVLMRRACEVACGSRPRRKPFVLSTYAADPYHEERRYHSEDDRGNCCYHFERKKPNYHHDLHPHHPKACQSLNLCGPCGPSCPCGACYPCQTCTSSPQCQYEDCVYARPVEPTSCCYYC